MSLLRKNIIYLLILQGSSYVVPLLTIPYLTRTLGLYEFGIYGLVLNISQYCVLFVDFGFNFTSTKKIAQNQGDANYISHVFWTTIYTKLMLCVLISSVILFLVYFQSNGMFKPQLVYILIMLVGTVIMPVWYFQGIEELSSVTKVTLFARLITLPLFFIFVQGAEDVSAAVIIQSATGFIGGAIACLIIYKSKKIKFVSVSLNDIILTIKDSYSVFVAMISINLYTISSGIIIAAVSTIDQVSIYTAADRIKGAVLGVFLILGNAFYPRLSNLFITSRRDAFLLVKRILVFQGGSALFIGVVMAIFSGPLSTLIYGDKYEMVSTLFVIYSPIYLLVLTATVFGNYILLPCGYKKEYTIMPIVCVIIHLPLCYFLAKTYGAIGASLSVVFVEIIALFLLSFVLYKKGLMREIIGKV